MNSDNVLYNWDVHKFGGTSVGSADCMRKCIEIIKPLLKQKRIAMVVSAMGGKPKVTDLLLDSVHEAASGCIDKSLEKLNAIREKHKICIFDLLSDFHDRGVDIINKIDSDLRDIQDLLRAVALMKTPHEQILELVSGYGEIWSATILAAALKSKGLPFEFLNARDVLFVSEGENIGTVVHWEESEKKLSEHIQKLESSSNSSNKVEAGNVNLIITGYIASTLDGVATTLKRDGSDFSASIFGKMLRSSGITIWTDVSGVYSADPRRVPEAIIIPEVSYTEAIELAYFGAKVIHPKTMAPAIMNKIPIYIRNTFEPDHPGTRIFKAPQKGQLAREKCVCGFSTVDNIALLNLEGTGMIGVPGIAHRLFGALKNANISVIFIAQASSEHSICFATKEIYAQVAKTAVEEAFFYELKQNLISSIKVLNNCSIIAAVGESMSNSPGVSGIFFGALGKARINVLSISQGCDERNISAVVDGKDAARALKAVHSAFWLSSQILTIGVVGGTGKVGNALLQTLLDQLAILEDRFDINIQIRGVINSTKMIISDNLNSTLKNNLLSMARKSNASPISPVRTKSSETLRRSNSNLSFEELVENGNIETPVPADIHEFFKLFCQSHSPNIIMIDCSNSQEIAKLHPKWILGGAHVITANKRALSSSIELYNEVFSATKLMNRSYLSEVTIGASVPVLTTLNDLLYSGDAIHSIVGLVSVSVGQVLTGICDEGLSFSESISRTHAAGLFEDDEFTDLEGIEAAQKLLILARALNVPLTLSEINVEPLAKKRHVESWKNCSKEFELEDKLFSDRAKVARENGCTLRYVQRIECSPPVELSPYSDTVLKASITLEEVPLSSSLAQVKGAIYYFSFHTDRYSQSPLVIQGPLSDSLNTASGIVGDLLRIARSLGASDKGQQLRNK